MPCSQRNWEHSQKKEPTRFGMEQISIELAAKLRNYARLDLDQQKCADIKKRPRYMLIGERNLRVPRGVKAPLMNISCQARESLVASMCRVCWDTTQEKPLGDSKNDRQRGEWECNSATCSAVATSCARLSGFTRSQADQNIGRQLSGHRSLCDEQRGPPLGRDTVPLPPFGDHRGARAGHV
jgi:hypothetical protein